jgi:hypothetical protein
MFMHPLNFCLLDCNYFHVDETFYKQTDWMAMGSSLSCIIRNLVLESLFDVIFPNLLYKPAAIFKYIDDIFLIFSQKSTFKPCSQLLMVITPNFNAQLRSSTIPALIIWTWNSSERKYQRTGILRNLLVDGCSVFYLDTLIRWNIIYCFRARQKGDFSHSSEIPCAK